MEQVIKIRGLICDDEVALEKWTTIVDHIVKSPSDRIRIKKLFKDHEHDAAVLKSLELWCGYGEERADLLKVLQDHGLNTLAGKIKAEGVLNEESWQCRQLNSRTGIWFEVGEVPYNFTGREAELEALHQKLTSSHCTAAAITNIVSVRGLGGVGKSSLARGYAHRYRNEYAGNVLWINAETAGSMKASFVRLANRLGLGVSDQELNDDIARKVYKRFEDQKSLFIFDNVEEKPHFRQFQSKIEDPAKQTPYILVTTRRNDVASLPGNELCLDVLTLDEATQLIQRQVPHVRDRCAQKLAFAVQMLPLALQQALAYINDRYTRDAACISKYLKEFEVSEQTLLADERFKENNDYSLTTYATWTLTLTRIKTMEADGGEMAIRTIEALAYLNPDLITRQFVRNIFMGRSADVEPGLKLLERFSMITIGKNGDTIMIHRLVQKVIRMSLSTGQEVNVLKPVMEAIRRQFAERVFTDYTRECMSHGIHLFEFQVKQSELIRGKSVYLSRLCYFLNQYGNYSAALFVAEESSAAYESIVGAEHEDTMKMKWETADAHYYMDNFTAGTEILESILPISQTKLGDEHGLTTNIQTSLADVYSTNGDYEKAITIYDEIIPVWIRLQGTDSDNALITQGSKGIALRKLGKLEEALELLQYVYKKSAGLHGEKGLLTLDAKVSLGLVWKEKGDLKKAIDIFTDVYEGRLQILGELHPDTIRAKANTEAVRAELLRQTSSTS